MQNIICGYDVSMKNVAFAGQCAIHFIRISSERICHVFYAVYGEFQFPIAIYHFASRFCVRQVHVSINPRTSLQFTHSTRALYHIFNCFVYTKNQPENESQAALRFHTLIPHTRYLVMRFLVYLKKKKPLMCPQTKRIAFPL